MVVVHKREQLERHRTGDELSESVGWHARIALDVGERFAAKRLTHVIFRCFPAPTDGVSGRRELTRTGLQRA